MPNGYDRMTIKQERFARKYIANGGNASQAYRDVYNTRNMSEKTLGRAAHEVKENPKVAAKIEKIKAEQSDFQQITLEEIGSGLRRVAAQAEANGQAAAAAQALVALGKLAGLYVDKQRLTVDGAQQHLAAVQALADKPVADENVVRLTTV